MGRLFTLCCCLGLLVGGCRPGSDEQGDDCAERTTITEAADASDSPPPPDGVSSPPPVPDRWPQPHIAPAYQVAEVESSGALTGQVTAVVAGHCVSYEGDRCPDGAPAEPCLVAPGPLRDAVVVIEGLAAGAAADSTGAVVAVEGCTIEPRVQLAAVGQTVSIAPAMAEAVRLIRHDGYRDLGEVVPGTEEDPHGRRLRVPGLIHLRLDRARGVRGWIWVVEHPYAAVTGADGRFHIDGIPVPTGDRAQVASGAGAAVASYTLRVWHEAFAERQVAVRITADEVQVLDIELGDD